MVYQFPATGRYGRQTRYVAGARISGEHASMAEDLEAGVSGSDNECPAFVARNTRPTPKPVYAPERDALLEGAKKLTISRKGAEMQKTANNEFVAFFAPFVALRLCAKLFCSLRNFLTPPQWAGLRPPKGSKGARQAPSFGPQEGPALRQASVQLPLFDSYVTHLKLPGITYLLTYG